MRRSLLIALLGVAALFFVAVVSAVVIGLLALFAIRTEVVQAAPPVQAVIDALQLEPEVHLDRDQGILVAGVEAGSPAEAAGLVRGDVITAVNGEAINLAQEFFELLYNDLEVGDSIELTVIHGDEQRTLTAEVEEREGRPYLGIQTCCEDIRMPRGLLDAPGEFLPPFMLETGVVVSEVQPDSPAGEAGLQAGDIITEIDGEELGFERRLADILQSHEPGDAITLTVEREGEEEPVELGVTLGEHPDNPGQAYLGIRYRQGFPPDSMPHFMPHPEDGTEIPFGEPPLIFPDLPEGITGAAVVMEVVPGGPAEEAGLSTGNFIIALDGETIENQQDLVEAIRSHEPGDQVELTVLNMGEQDPQNLEVTLGEHPDEPGRAYLGVSAGSIQIQRSPEGQSQPSG